MCALKIGGWAPIDLLLHDAEEAARDRTEAERLTYVAATRARDVLVVPVIGDGVYEGGWLDPLMPAVYPPEPARRAPRRPAGCGTFTSLDSVMNRPEGDPARPHTVAPGRYEFAGYSVVWWDPHVLHLGAASSFGLRRDDLIVKDGDMFAVDDRMSAYEAWRAGVQRAVEAGRQPSLRVDTATAWAAEAAKTGIDAVIADSSAIQVVALPRASASAEATATGDRPRGPRFGALVHAVLATVPLDATDEVVARTAGTQGRILVASQDEVTAAAAVVSAVLRHDLISRAKAADAVRRETPLSWVQKDGTLIEGVLDLAFAEDGVTTVVDFKTDHELAAGEARYRAQLQQYVNAVAAVTKRPAKGVLFRV
jgi:ATP-dependent exoDNAse (exonuclease V) beta subunit